MPSAGKASPNGGIHCSRASRRNFLRRRFSFCRIALVEFPSDPFNESREPPSSLNSMSRFNSESVMSRFVTQRRRKCRSRRCSFERNSLPPKHLLSKGPGAAFRTPAFTLAHSKTLRFTAREIANAKCDCRAWSSSERRYCSRKLSACWVMSSCDRPGCCFPTRRTVPCKRREKCKNKNAFDKCGIERREQREVRVESRLTPYVSSKSSDVRQIRSGRNLGYANTGLGNQLTDRVRFGRTTRPRADAVRECRVRNRTLSWRGHGVTPLNPVTNWVCVENEM